MFFWILKIWLMLHQNHVHFKLIFQRLEKDWILNQVTLHYQNVDQNFQELQYQLAQSVKNVVANQILKDTESARNVVIALNKNNKNKNKAFFPFRGILATQKTIYFKQKKVHSQKLILDRVVCFVTLLIDCCSQS